MFGLPIVASAVHCKASARSSGPDWKVANVAQSNLAVRMVL